jgi:hypothetical protein
LLRTDQSSAKTQSVHHETTKGNKNLINQEEGTTAKEIRKGEIITKKFKILSLYLKQWKQKNSKEILIN